MARIFRCCVLSGAFFVAAGGPQNPWQGATVACPSCKNANETNPLLPKAYMYSILFMLAMPATVFTGFGIAFYRLSRKAAQEQLALIDAAREESDADSSAS